METETKAKRNKKCPSRTCFQSIPSLHSVASESPLRLQSCSRHQVATCGSSDRTEASDRHRPSFRLIPAPGTSHRQRATHTDSRVVRVFANTMTDPSSPSHSDSIISDDNDDGPEQISFAQGREQAQKRPKDEPISQNKKKRKRNRRIDRVRASAGDEVADGSSDVMVTPAEKRKKDNGIEIHLPLGRTIEVRSRTKPVNPVGHSNFKEEMLSRRKRVRPISTSHSAAYRSPKQPYR